MAAYDHDARKDVPLFTSAADLDAERASLADLAKESPSRRTRIVAETRLHLLSSYYDDPAKSRCTPEEGIGPRAVAANFGGQSYDLKDTRRSRSLRRADAESHPPGARAT
jgi:hypothetical protein